MHLCAFMCVCAIVAALQSVAEFMKTRIYVRAVGYEMRDIAAVTLIHSDKCGMLHAFGKLD